jgi:transposase
MLNAKRFKKHHSSDQGHLLPTYPTDLVAEDHLARVVSEIVDTLDLTELYQKFSWEGGASFHPKSMVRTLFYAYSQGERSSRRIQKQCQENFVYLYLSSGVKPDFRTISEFRRKHFDILKNIFKQIVQLCYNLGMITIGKISLDGTKIKADAADRKIIEKDKLAAELAEIEQQIPQILAEAEATDIQEDAAYGETKTGDELPEQLQHAQQRQQQIKQLLAELEREQANKLSTTDQDARFMKDHGRIRLCYNAQCATENQVILAYDVTNDEDDRAQLIPMVAELEQVATQLTGKDDYPLEDVKVITDAGYESGTNLQHLDEREIDGYVASQFARVRAKEQKGEIPPRPFSKDKFSYHADGDYYQCPVGQKLQYHRTTKVKGKTATLTARYYKGTNCPSCAFQQQCATSKTGYRQITRYVEYDPYREKIDQKLQTTQGKAMMRHRATDVEPVFGQMKQNIFRRDSFLVRGTQKVKGEFCLGCIAHNIKKIANHLKSTNNDDNMSNIMNIRRKAA